MKEEARPLKAVMEAEEAQELLRQTVIEVMQHDKQPWTKPLTVALRSVERKLAALVSAVNGRQDWQPIDTAPKGSWPVGPEDVRDPAYVAPPHLWLRLPDGQRCVGSFDAYYAEGGNGYDGDSPWVEEFSGERVRPTHWLPLPPDLGTGGSALAEETKEADDGSGVKARGGRT